ncbi:BQ2448_7152 [Microbotryum intermedium]|uniref:BQ2448_7152 protein n=1 Tax=Microbotryum intermedium TaxID=269621 RepID=A0A238FJ07_9BASI|nr:BQ2448_7152 [Microbotryum intermedium]
MASNSIRVIMDDPSSLRFAVQTTIRKHFRMTATPFMFARPQGAELDPEVKKLFSKCVKLNFLVTKATKKFPISCHMNGKEMVTKLPNATPLNHIVQVRFTLPSRSTGVPTYHKRRR